MTRSSGTNGKKPPEPAGPSIPAEEAAPRFFARFASLERAHGETRLLAGQVSEKGKQEAASHMIHSPLTVELWQEHLDGGVGIGGCPIRDDSTCVYGAIDIDRYDLDLFALAAEVDKLQLPLTVCRTKSGGAHLYCFTSEPVPAELMRGKLMEWAVALGYSGVEVFPQQTRLAGPADFGAWINLPYFGGDATNRYAVVGMAQLNVRDFLAWTDASAVTGAQLREARAPTDVKLGDWFHEGPPCLQSLAISGFGEGGRNKVLFNVGVYLRKRYGDDWEPYLDKYNQKFCDPALGHKEVAQIVKHVNKKSYEYTSHDPPLVQVCNRQICLTRKFGTGGGDGDPGVVFGTLEKLNTNPPTWIWDVDGARIELATQELKDQQRFHTKCIETLNKWPITLKPKQWSELIRRHLAGAVVREVPREATPEGTVRHHLMRYCTARTQARDREELLEFKVWTDDHGISWFNAPHFRQYLEQQRVHLNEKEFYSLMRRAFPDLKHKFFNLGGEGINCWGVPAFKQRDEPYAFTPRQPVGAPAGQDGESGAL